jgi:predicted CoA-substrate-specific enzyme activase
MIKVAGIDSGSGFTKVVIIEALGDDLSPRVVARAQEKTGADIEQVARRTLDAARKEAGIEWDELSYVAATGFGRYGISFRDIQITEITSGARGAHFLLPQSDAVLDIGSQSTRAVSLKENGRVRTFKTNDKCAAGSGSFIQRAAKYLEIDINEVGELALRAENPQSISSVCAVLAESEIINLVSTGATVEDIMRGIYDSLAHRASLLLKRVGETKELVFIGGVALQRGMVKALQERLERSVVVPPNCTFVCALGAALLGLKRLQSGRTQPTPVRTASLFAGTP